MKFKAGDLVTWELLRSRELCIVKRRTYQAHKEKDSILDLYEVYVFSDGNTMVATSLNLSPVSKGTTK